MSTADLTKATRELFEKSLVDQVYMKTPIIEDLKTRGQIVVKGGTSIQKLVDTDTIEDLMQVYEVNDALTDEKKTTLEKPSFTLRYGQLPLKYDADEATENISASYPEQLLDLAEHLAMKGQDGTRRWLDQQLFNSGSTTGVADGNANQLQSLVSALDHDVTYGGISRSISGGTNDWWQGADPADLTQNISSSSQGTATNLTISNLRKWINETDVAHYMKSEDDLMIAMCPTLYNKLLAEMEAKVIYKPASDQKQGVRKMELDGHQIVSVPYLQTTSTMKSWLFILNMNYFELRVHSDRNFRITDFKWQGDIANGHDYYLSRILFKGNIVCWKPNSSMWLSNVS